MNYSDLFHKEKSLYEITDYRSKFYHGNWVKAWLKEVITQAQETECNMYETMWKMYTHKLEHMPKSLYKFFPFNENSIKCIEENVVFMNSPDKFNDPFDCLICANEDEFIKKYLLDYFNDTNAIQRGILTKSEYLKLVYSVTEPPRHSRYWDIYRGFESVLSHLRWDEEKKMEKECADELYQVCRQASELYQNTLSKLRKQTIKVSSFSCLKDEELLNSMEMWAHYAGNHHGFCVEYDIKADINDRKELPVILGSLLPCSYGARQIQISNDKLYKHAMQKKFTNYQKVQFEKSILLTFLRKSSSWSYEREWRLVLPNDLCSAYGNLIPFFPIRAIYLGCKMPEDNKEYMYRLAKRKGIIVCNMDLQEHYFELDSFPVDVNRYFKQKEYYRQKYLNDSDYQYLHDDILKYL